MQLTLHVHVLISLYLSPFLLHLTIKDFYSSLFSALSKNYNSQPKIATLTKRIPRSRMVGEKVHRRIRKESLASFTEHSCEVSCFAMQPQYNLLGEVRHRRTGVRTVWTYMVSSVDAENTIQNLLFHTIIFVTGNLPGSMVVSRGYEGVEAHCFRFQDLAFIKMDASHGGWVNLIGQLFDTIKGITTCKRRWNAMDNKNSHICRSRNKNSCSSMWRASH